MRNDDPSRKQRPDRAARAAADLKNRLRQPWRPPEAKRAMREDSG